MRQFYVSCLSKNKSHETIHSAFWKYIISISVCEGAGIISGLLSADGIENWFHYIEKPSWQLPREIFGPVWSILYLLMGISFAKVWISTPRHLIKLKPKAELVFGIQLFLNFCWSIIFFRFESPVWAFLDIMLLILFLVINIYVFHKFSKAAAWLLIPYLIWVCFAAYLNYTIWMLN